MLARRDYFSIGKSDGLGGRLPRTLVDLTNDQKLSYAEGYHKGKEMRVFGSRMNKNISNKSYTYLYC